jgi:hypothetical protein
MGSADQSAMRLNLGLGALAVLNAAPAGTLTGTTLAANVLSSSLTSVGTIGTGVWQGTAIADSYIASAATWNAKQSAITFGTGVLTAIGINLGTSGSLATIGGALTSNRILIGGGTSVASASGSINTDSNGLLMLGASTGSAFNPNIPGDTANGDLTGSNGLGLLGQIKQNYSGVTWAAGANIANALYASGAPDAGGSSRPQALRVWAEVTGANDSASVTGLSGNAVNSGSGIASALTGINGMARVYSSGSASIAVGSNAGIIINGTGNVTTHFVGYLVGAPSYGSTGRVTGNLYGMLVPDFSGSASAEIYGVDIRDQTKGSGIAASYRGRMASGTGKYNAYFDGTAQNYLAGVTGVGNTPASTSYLTLGASTTGVSSLNVPHGSAPSSPVNGDVWTTTSGMFARINGGTVGPFGSGSGSTAWGSTVGETDVASASTTDLGAVNDDAIRITGTTTITSFGTVAEGTARLVRFDGALTLTYNATSLILPGAANITTAQGDSLIAYSLGSGNWKVMGYWKQDGTPLVIGANLNYGTNPGAIVVGDSSITSGSGAGTAHSYAWRVDGSEILKVYAESDGAGGIQNPGVFVNGGRLLTTLSAYAAGTVYSLTNSSAALDFGTTDPSITITTAGTWKITACVQLTYTGATVATETASLKLRRTNNTAADLTSSTVTIDLPVATTLTNTYGMVMLPAVYYTTANVNDVVTIFGNVSATLGAGTIDAAAAGTWIVAERLS